MPKIYYKATDYSGGYASINSTKESSIECRNVDLILAILTVGSPSGLTWANIAKYGLARAFTQGIIEKLTLLRLNLHTIDDCVALHPIFDAHIADKKRDVSYNLGMAFANFYARKLFGMRGLTHLETIIKLGEVSLISTPSGRGRHPDLIGQSEDAGWHVFEAKGMSRNNLSAKIAEAKEQARCVSSIKGHPPVTATACATWMSQSKITTCLKDPEPSDGKSFDFKGGAFVYCYYKPFFMMAEAMELKPQPRLVAGLKVYDFSFSANDCTYRVGLEENTYEWFRERQDEHGLRQLEDGWPYAPQFDWTSDLPENLSIGRDGYVVSVDA